MPSFADILDKTAESIERPPLAPKGTYVFVVSGQPKKVDRKGFEVLDFPMRAVRPTEDVDTDDLKAFAPDGNLGAVQVRRSFLFSTEDESNFRQTEFNMKEFLTVVLGQDPSLTLKELMSGAVNKQCLGVLDYRPNPENPEQMYHELRKTAPLS